MLVFKCTLSLDILYSILLEQELDALCQSADGSVLRFHHLRKIERNVADVDAAVLRVVQDLVVHVGVVEEGFRGDTADVETGASESAALFYACYLCVVVLDERCSRGGRWCRYLQSCLSGLNRGHIPSHAATNDDEVFLLCALLV